MSSTPEGEPRFCHVGGGQSFAIPPTLEDKLPPAGPDGLAHIDVKVKGKWEGILVVNADRRCVGVFSQGQVGEWNLPFMPEEIEDLRPACLWNRFLACIPQGLIYWTPYACILLVPGILLSGTWIGMAAPIIAILVGLVGQCIVMAYLRQMYCIPGCGIIMAIMASQLVAVGLIIKWIIRQHAV